MIIFASIDKILIDEKNQQITHISQDVSSSICRTTFEHSILGYLFYVDALAFDVGV